MIKNTVLYISILVSSFVLLSGNINRDLPDHSYMKGMTVSCQTWGYEWATPEMNSTMDELKSLGVSWIAIHPYARIRENGSIKFRDNLDQFHIVTPLQWSAEKQMPMMIKPHLAYWGTKFDWRGDIDFDTPEKWQRFFNDYKKWMAVQARIAEQNNASVLCIGTELRHTIRFEQQWREIIAMVRSLYTGKITYAANWDDYMKVPFWDDLDYVGIQAYFPLTQSETPTDTEIRNGWQQVLSQLRDFSKKTGKQIVFTELGYNTSIRAAAEPWSHLKSSSKEAHDLQKRCLRAALELTANEPAIAGVFLWKWFAETRSIHHENFNLQSPDVKSLIANMWTDRHPAK